MVLPTPRGPAKRYACAMRLLRERVPQRPHDRRLAHHRVEGVGPPPPREHLVAHRGRGLAARGELSGRAPAVDGRRPAISPGAGSGQGIPRHTRGSAYRCSLPGLAGLADSRRVGPSLHRHSSGLSPTRRHLGRGFRLAGADCEYRAPLPPRLARPHSITLAAPRPPRPPREWRRGRDLNPRYAFWTYTRFPVVPLRPLGHLSPALRRALSHCPWRKNGGGGGIRTHVGTHRPQLDFESSPVRPLRYPSARRVRKNACISSPASSASTPPVTATRWFHAGSSSTRAWLTTAPGLRVPRAEHERADPRVHARARAHRARLDGHVERRAGQPVVPHAARGVAQGLDLGVRRRIGPATGRLCPRPTTSPSRTTTAPTGTSPARGGHPGLLERGAHERLVERSWPRAGGTAC